ncbi:MULTISPECIES: hypothetical protein [unclassified Marinovum]|uniref:hypothetical protein n=1 Tax=unclassified Marinovum TaxID=2647166 RepID=UPI003EDC63DA
MSLSGESLSVIEGDARVSCRRLAKALGFSKLGNLHALVGRHLDELQDFGRVFLLTQKNSGPGRPAKSYYLNEHQAVAVCMWANTPKARQARMQIIEVFLAWRRGDLHGLAVMRQPDAPLSAERPRDAFEASADRAEATVRHLRSLSEADEYLRELTHLPIFPSSRRPPWWHHLDVREFLTVSHRQMSIIEAARQGKDLFDDRCPGKSAIHIYWQRLDGAKKVVADLRRNRATPLKFAKTPERAS